MIQSDSSANNISELSLRLQTDYGLFTLSTHESEKLKLAAYDAKEYKSLHSLLAFPINCVFSIDE